MLQRNAVETEVTPLRSTPAHQPPDVSPRPPALKSRGRYLAVLLGVVFLVVVIGGVVLFRSSVSSADSQEAFLSPATATVERRDFVRTIRVHGVVEALRAYNVAAPRLAGVGGPGGLIIMRLAQTGTRVKKGDVLVEFDRQTQERNFLDRQAEFRDLEEQIRKRKADQIAAKARDDTELKQAENALESARVEMRKNEVISRIDAEKNAQNLAEAEARLAQLRETYQLKRTAAEADLRILEIQRDRAYRAMLHAQGNAEKLVIRSQMDGLVVLIPIGRSSGIQEVQEGDEVRPGNSFMQVVDPGRMQVRAKINQADVPYLRVGQPVQIHLDAYPDFVLPGRLDDLAVVGITSSLNSRVRTFTAIFSIQGTDSRLLPDLSAGVDIEVERVPSVLVAPRDALILENGQAFVRVKNGLGFERVPVKVGPMSDTEVVIESGVSAGAVLARHQR
jgi:multidrug resistance efflux pump